MKRGFWVKTAAMAMIAVMSFGMFTGFGTDAAQNSAKSAKTADAPGSGATPKTAGYADSDSISTERILTNYTHVSGTYKSSPYTGSVLPFPLSKSLTKGNELLSSDNRGYPADVVLLGVGDTVTLRIDVPKTAQYFIGFDYYSYDSSILPIEMSLTVDGDFPFYEARSLSFETTWTSDGEKNIDRYGNEIVAMPDKLFCWEHKCLSDSGYRYSRPLAVELTEGVHELCISAKEGRFLLGTVSLEPVEEIAEYNGSHRAEGESLIVIEAEDFTKRNDSSIHAVGEYDSALSPVYTKETILNTVDEDSFSKAGQKISYSFKVENAGYYNLALNYRQSEKNGFPVFIDYEIDGQIPSKAFKDYPMEYSTKYRVVTLSDDEMTPLSTYLERGTHEVSLTISSDPVRYALEAVDEMISGISDLSLEVTKVVGTNKDKYRDLKITRYIPDITDRLYGWADRMYELAKRAEVFVDADEEGEVAAFSYLLIAADELRSLADEPNELVYRVGELSTGTNSINTQLANFVDIIGSNRISIDRIYVCQEDAELPEKPGFFKSLWFSIVRFFYSFFSQSYSMASTDDEHISVWVNRPRQYVEVMQKLIDDEFTKETGIEVDLAIMTDPQKLILSNASNDTPDIATGINYSIPFEMGIRGALVDLTSFDDYREVFGRYSDGILVPSVIGDGLYSLPETMNFYVLFYRSDILGKLGLTVPDTMEELVAMLPDLQMRGLNVYYPTAVMQAMRNFHGTTPLIFQNGGKLYGQTAADLLIDSEETIKGFTELTELFTLYNLPVDVPNFYQHFRNGDLALGIADFNSYNLISNAAPEIENSWGIALVPGVADAADGEVRRFMSGGAESTVMFKSDSEREQKAWRFMEWWSRASVQAEFGQMIQILYGDEYIWPTANLEAFKLLPYPSSDKAIILEQAESILEAPRLLGSYMLERELSNAFNDIVVNGDTVRSRIDDAVKIVNRETDRKLEEFGYSTGDGTVIRPYYIPSVERVREILGSGRDTDK